MTKPNPFPYRLYAQDYETYTHSPDLARKVWMRIRPEAMSWYAADCKIVSPTEITLYVYTMANNVYGGTGKKIFEKTITEFTSEEREILNREVQKIYLREAEAEYERRLEEQRRSEIARIKVELFGE